MRYIDTVTHFMPQPFFDKMLEAPGFSGGIAKRMRHVRSLWDLDVRRRVVDRTPDYRQILSLGMPPIDVFASPAEAPAFARLANDGLAELCASDKGRFAGWLAALPMNAPDEAVKEAERAFKNGANGLQLHTNVNGMSVADARFLPVYETARRADRPILLHPARRADTPDLAGETQSRYEIWAIFGWPYETTAVMTHLVFSGMMDKLRGTKLLVHHMGAMVPFFESRIRHGWAEIGTRSTSTDPMLAPQKLARPVLEYFRDFYADTALAGSRAGIQCGLDFFGPDKVMFASDCPFDSEGGALYIAETIAALESIDLAPAARDKISFANAGRLFGLT